MRKMVIDNKTFSGVIGRENVRELLPYVAKVQKNLQNAVQDFHWYRQFAEKDRYLPKMDIALKKLDVGISGEQVSDILTREKAFSEDIFQLLFPGSEEDGIGYHKPEHADATAVTSTKMYIGGLLEMKQNGELEEIFGSQENVQKSIELHIISAYLHELTDWWKLVPEGSDIQTEATKNAKFQQALEMVRHHLVELGLSPDDFNRLNALDNFSKSTSDTVAVAEKEDFAPLKPEEAENLLYVDDSDPLGLFKSLPLEKRHKVLKLNSESIRGADFAQVLNPAYLQTIELDIGDDKVNLPYGPAALALEMFLWRKQFLKSYQWASDDGGINWKNVGVGEYFWDNFVCRDLPYGLKNLQFYDDSPNGEFDIAVNRFMRLHGLVKDGKMPDNFSTPQQDNA